MAMLIRGGHLMTMTGQGSRIADILIAHGKIARVAAHIDAPPGVNLTTIEAKGVTVLPGLVDACIHPCGAQLDFLKACALHSGVTSALLMPEDGSCCQLMRGGSISRSRFRLMDAATIQKSACRERIAACCADGCVPVFPVDSSSGGRATLEAAAGSPCILLVLAGDDALCDDIAGSSASVIIALQRSAATPWSMAKKLTDAGVSVALSCCYPSSKMHLLPLIAGLCCRGGMSEEEAIRCITVNPAEMLGLHHRGRIEEGCPADLVLYDGNPTLLATSIVAVIAGGRIVRSA